VKAFFVKFFHKVAHVAHDVESVLEYFVVSGEVGLTFAHVMHG